MATAPAPRYLRFVRALALGALVTTACGDDEEPRDGDATTADTDVLQETSPPTEVQIVDGPLHPPDLPAA